jgi:hypothetical protein
MLGWKKCGVGALRQKEIPGSLAPHPESLSPFILCNNCRKL